MGAAEQVEQAYFPERLAKCYIVHMPRFFVSVWRMVSRFIEKSTLEKIVIVTNDDEKKIFIEEIGEEALPVEYGGKAILRAIQDVQTFDNTVAAPEGVKPSNDQCCCQ
ncbi:hypothetical protein GOBAR_DD26988 [Gossypium barbadense]|nr:hypothetical protein GOBAR_DD26988 [Gossypium barbadense]